MKKGLVAIGLLCLFLALSMSTANAAIIGVSGPIVLIPPPPSVNVNVLQSDTQAVAFDEQQNVVLANPLAVDITTQGNFGTQASLTPGTIAAGTTVSSHFVHYDPVTGSFVHGVQVNGGVIRFDHRIVGIITTGGNLDSSDSVVGVGGTTYPTGFAKRGLLLDPFEGDNLTVACDTLTLNALYAGEDTAQLRVITDTGTCPPTGGQEGCSPTFWATTKSETFWEGMQPNDRFNKTFSVKGSDKTTTLHQALQKVKGKEPALKRQAVAALLNASSSVVDYPYTRDQVIAIVQHAYATKDFKGARLDLAAQNKLGCFLETVP